MNEIEWVKSLLGSINEALHAHDSQLTAYAGHRLLYALEITEYDIKEEPKYSRMMYQTDLLVKEEKNGDWKPRVIVEVKLGNISTHDAITYSQKSATHRQVHPYLRYGVLIGENGDRFLPGRLFRHGTEFDFMMSWKAQKPSKEEFSSLIDLIRMEVDASRSLEDIIYNTRNHGRPRYFSLHRPLILK